MLPKELGGKGALPTPQADIYAFGLVVFQVGEQIAGIGHFHVYFLQVLTGESPFRGATQPALALFVLRGRRPAKPVNGSAIGFSDSLWDFTQSCWDGEMELRPTVEEVVAHLGEAAAGWHGLMPPCSPIEDVVPGPKEMSDQKKLSEFGVFILPRHRPLIKGTGSVSQPPLSPIELRAIPNPFAPPNAPATQSTEPRQEKSQMVFARPFKVPQTAPSQLPQEGFWYYIWKFLGFFGFQRRPLSLGPTYPRPCVIPTTGTRVEEAEQRTDELRGKFCWLFLYIGCQRTFRFIYSLIFRALFSAR